MSWYYTPKPTVVPVEGFDASADANALRAAMKGFGTDEQAIIDILCARSADQRTQILETYASELGRVSLGGRTYLAHRNQLKEAPKEDYQRKVVVTARSERRGTKRGRERYGDAAYEDGEDSFYGFAADSFVFAEDSNDGVDVDMEVDMEREGVSRLSSVDRESQIRDDPVEGSSTQRLPDFSVPSIDNRAVARRSTRSKRYKKDKDFVYY